METIFDDIEEISGIKVLIKDFTEKSIDDLKEIVDRGKEKMGSGIIILGSDTEEKAVFVAGVTKDLTGKIKAGDIVRTAAIEHIENRIIPARAALPAEDLILLRQEGKMEVQ